MSMSTHVIAFRDMDGEFKRILEAKKFCDERHLSYPKEVEAYFRGYAGISENGLREQFLTVNIDTILTRWQDESSAGYELEVTQLPKEVKILRFYNSW